MPISDHNLIALPDLINGAARVAGTDTNPIYVTLSNGLSGTGSISQFTTTIFTAVSTGDITPSAYVTGSQGNIKTVKEYNNGTSPGGYAVLTTFKYEDPHNPNFPTYKQVTVTTV